jgi:hypothetical protein
MEAANPEASHRYVEESSMWYRIFGCLVTLAILVAPLATDAQPTGHSRRIGWLRPAGRPSGAAFEAFLHSLRDMGYVEGQNLIIKLRQGEGKTALLPPWPPSWSVSRWRSL